MSRYALLLPCLSAVLLCQGCLSFGVETLLSTGISLCAPKTLNKIDTYYHDVTLIEGRSSRNEVTAALGQPDELRLDVPRPFARYDFRNKPSALKIRLRVARRNGNEMIVCVGSGEKLTVLVLYFDTQGIVRDIGLT